jgi:DNA-binding LacI/PurR family transcriptional regulator
MGRLRQDISIYQIAQEAEVSASTVSRVMNNRVGVGEDIRVKINKLLCKYNFTTNYPAPRRTRIAFMTAEKDQSGYISRALKGVFEYTRPHELDVTLIFGYDESGTVLLQRLRDQQCSAVIAGPGEWFKNIHPELAQSQLPTIFMDTIVEGPRLGYIDNDSYTGSCAAAQHLLELGHRKIGYILPFDGETVFDLRQRFQAYLDTMSQAGIARQESWIARALPIGDYSRGGNGIETMTQLLKQAPELTAVMAVDDGMALGALTAIHRSGRKIPDDISLTGFDNYDDTVNWFPSLTTVNHPIERIGYMAAEAIDQALKSPGDWVPPRLTLPTELIIRGSTGPCIK